MPKLDPNSFVVIPELKVAISDFTSKKSGAVYQKLSIVNPKNRELKMLFADETLLAYLEELGYDVDNLATEEENGKN